MTLAENPALKSILWYGGSTLICTTICKLIVTKFFFDYPIVILMLQMAATLFVVELLRVINVVKLPPYTFDKGKALFVPSLLLTYSSWLCLASYEGIAIPNFDTIHRFIPFAVLLMTVFYTRQQRLDRALFGIVLLVAVGGAVSVHLEPWMDRHSFFYGVLAMALQGAAYVQLEQLSQTFTPIDLLYMHSFNSLVYLLIADLIQDEIRDAFMYMMTSSTPLFTAIFFLLLVAGTISYYFTFAALTDAGALTTTVVSNVRAGLQVMVAYYLSIYLFYDVTPTLVNWVGLVVATAAGLLYLRRYRQSPAIASEGHVPLKSSSWST